MQSPPQAKRQSHVEVLKNPTRGVALVRIFGTIDETFDGEELAGLQRTVVFDMDAVTRVTSYGVREWINALKALDADYYCFIRCRPSLIVNFNLVSNFAVAGQLVSLYAPFFCETCDDTFEVLIDLRHQYGKITSSQPPRARCPTCREASELDDFPDVYFRYCSSRPPPRPPPQAALAIDGKASPRAAKFEISKEVVGDVTALWMNGEVDDRVRFSRIADGLEGIALMLLTDLEFRGSRGRDRFVEFCRSVEVPLYAARVSSALLGALLGEDGARAENLPFAILSVRVSAHCAPCKWSADHDLEVRGKEPPNFGPACPGCRAPTTLEIDPQARSLISELPAAEAPAAIAEYLELRPHDGLLSPDPEPGLTPTDRGPIAFGKYRLIRRLGYGGMAEVFLARQVGPNDFERSVALKRLLPEHASDERFVRMFTQEAKIVTRLSHPNVVQVFDFGKIAGQYYLAMEYVPSIDLGKCLRHLRALDDHMPVEIALFILAEVCAGLGAAHHLRDESGKPTPVLHRDVSPQNILLSSEGAVKVVDFGIAKADDSPSHTEHGAIKGKINYLAPERMGATDAVDVRSDLFAAGVILYECLTRETLFQRDNQLATMHAILNNDVPPISERRPDCAPLDGVLTRALSHDPDQRYQSAAELRADLERHLEQFGRPVTSSRFADWLRPLLDVADTGVRPDGEAQTTLANTDVKTAAMRRLVGETIDPADGSSPTGAG